MKIGLVSDTHNHLDPLLFTHFEGVDHILHAGDVGDYTLLAALERIAPVTAVAGNNDFDPRLRDLEFVALNGRGFLLCHIVNPHRPSEALRQRLDRHRPQVVVYGHTHQAEARWVEGVLFINPGYAGRPRFGQPRTIALLEDGAGELRHQFIPL